MAGWFASFLVPVGWNTHCLGFVSRYYRFWTMERMLATYRANPRMRLSKYIIIYRYHRCRERRLLLPPLKWCPYTPNTEKNWFSWWHCWVIDPCLISWTFICLKLIYSTKFSGPSDHTRSTYQHHKRWFLWRKNYRWHPQSMQRWGPSTYPEDWHGKWKSWFPQGISFSSGWFSGSIQ